MTLKTPAKRKNKPGAGRPPAGLPGRVAFRMTAAELERLQQDAIRGGRTVSQHVRWVLFRTEGGP